MNSTEVADIRELSLNEVEEVSGGVHVKLGPLNIMIGEKDIGIGFGVSIDGLGGFAIGTLGVCGALKGVGGGCTG